MVYIHLFASGAVILWIPCISRLPFVSIVIWCKWIMMCYSGQPSHFRIHSSSYLTSCLQCDEHHLLHTFRPFLNIPINHIDLADANRALGTRGGHLTCRSAVGWSEREQRKKDWREPPPPLSPTWTGTLMVSSSIWGDHEPPTLWVLPFYDVAAVGDNADRRKHGTGNN